MQESLRAASLPILVVAGMQSEAPAAGAPGLVTLHSGGEAAGLRQMLATRRRLGCRAVLSFGVAGGLDPDLRPGDVLLASAVLADSGRWRADPDILGFIEERLWQSGIRAKRAEIVGAESPLADVDSKARLRAETGAAAVDTESHVAAAYAAANNLPFAALRVVCDPAGRALPPAALQAIGPDGRLDHAGLAGSLWRSPGQLTSLLRLAGDAAAAFRALSRCRDVLGFARGLPELGKLLGDVA